MSEHNIRSHPYHLLIELHNINKSNNENTCTTEYMHIYLITVFVIFNIKNKGVFDSVFYCSDAIGARGLKCTEMMRIGLPMVIRTTKE